MAKHCPEDFNPWPPFVDIFASVILVLMLFLLITIVNIGYYAQFKFKTSYTASVVTKAPIITEETSKVSAAQCVPQAKLEKKKIIVDGISFHKINKPQQADSQQSLFSGGKAEGNAVSYAINKDPKQFTNQKVITKNRTLTVHFDDKEIFLSNRNKHKLQRFVGEINRRSKRAQFTIFVSDPKTVASATLARQVSLGRVLNIKGLIKKSNVQQKNIRMNLQKQIPNGSNFGSITIEVVIP